MGDRFQPQRQLTSTLALAPDLASTLTLPVTSTLILALAPHQPSPLLADYNQPTHMHARTHARTSYGGLSSGGGSSSSSSNGGGGSGS